MNTTIHRGLLAYTTEEVVSKTANKENRESQEKSSNSGTPVCSIVAFLLLLMVAGAVLADKYFGVSHLLRRHNKKRE